MRVKDLSVCSESLVFEWVDNLIVSVGRRQNSLFFVRTETHPSSLLFDSIQDDILRLQITVSAMAYSYIAIWTFTDSTK